jgi:hypothetical protein
VDTGQRLRDGLDAAVGAAASGLAAADALCHACVDLLDVDGAAISLIHEGSSRGTFGSSGELSRRLDEYQFTYGEGPCLDAVAQDRPILVADLADLEEQRWPAFTQAVRAAGIAAVFAFPISLVASPIGAIDLFCRRPGRLDADRLNGAHRAAQLASLPLLDMMAGIGRSGRQRTHAWSELASLERVEVYQATGMIIAQLDVSPAEALVRLRAYAFAHDLTASQVAWKVVGRTLSFGDDDGFGADE